MSYCGTCGTFYSPECHLRASGGCIPAVNPFEQQVVEARARILSVGLMAEALLQSEKYPGKAEALRILAGRLDHLFD